MTLTVIIWAERHYLVRPCDLTSSKTCTCTHCIGRASDTLSEKKQTVNDLTASEASLIFRAPLSSWFPGYFTSFLQQLCTYYPAGVKEESSGGQNQLFSFAFQTGNVTKKSSIRLIWPAPSQMSATPSSPPPSTHPHPVSVLQTFSRRSCLYGNKRGEI